MVELRLRVAEPHFVLRYFFAAAGFGLGFFDRWQAGKTELFRSGRLGVSTGVDSVGLLRTPQGSFSPSFKAVFQREGTGRHVPHRGAGWPDDHGLLPARTGAVAVLHF